MLKLFYIILPFSVCLTANADLPNWARSATKNTAFDQFVEWMSNDAKFYRISKTETQDSVSPSGKDSVIVTIYFDDSSGCKNREHIAECTLLAFDGPLSCFQTLSDCGKNLERKFNSINSR